MLFATSHLELLSSFSSDLGQHFAALCAVHLRSGQGDLADPVRLFTQPPRVLCYESFRYTRALPARI